MESVYLGKCIVFCWVLSHVGIYGDEQADHLATSSHTLKQTTVPLPCQVFYVQFQTAIKLAWQKEWYQETEYKLHLIKPIIGTWESSSDKNHRLEVFLCCLRLGQTHSTHYHLLTDNDPPVCQHCGGFLGVQHMLWLCPNLGSKRCVFFKELFQQHIPFQPVLLLGEEPVVPFKKLFQFLHGTGFFRDI